MQFRWRENWRAEYSEYLRGADVVVVADKDEKGMQHAKSVRRSLLGVAASVEIVEAASGKDAHDHLDAGASLAEFVPVPPRFKRDLLGGHVPKPPAWLYEPVLLARTYTLISADAGAGKTMLALATMQPIVAAGHQVVYLDMENGPDVFKERADAIGYTASQLDNEVAYFPYPSPARKELADLVVEVAALKPVLVVFDAKANFAASADLDEDLAADMTVWHQHVVQPLQQLGASVLDLDHEGHKADGRPRGSSAKEAVAEASWTLNPTALSTRTRPPR